jgi:hypothetical protein
VKHLSFPRELLKRLGIKSGEDGVLWEVLLRVRKVRSANARIDGVD